MAKVRIYELARELGVESKDVLQEAQDLGVDVKTASSSVEDGDADLIRLAFAPDGGSDGAAPGVDGAGAAAPGADAAPAAEARPGADAAAAAEARPGAGAPTSEAEAEPEPAAAVTSLGEPEGRSEERREGAVAAAVPEPADDVDIVSVAAGVSVAEFAEAIGRSPGDVVRELLTRGRAAGAGATMPEDLMEEVGEVFGVIVDVAPPPAPSAPKPTEAIPEFDDADEDLAPRPPVVTVMGHVDHGKTTLLDTIRKSKVVESEQGGITQHIGAYQVEVGGNRITFIDTPGHEAFTTMRARGADVTDIVVLVVAADDGVMPQTVEAISHARAAGVEMVVAINKADLPAADPMRVRTQLTEHGVVTEELGGDVPSVEVSAATGLGVDSLLEVIDLIAQLQEYRANPDAPAMGVVIESQLDARTGPTATVIVKRGTLQQGHSFVAGPVAGRVRAMMDETGARLKSAGPSTPVMVMGWDEVPTAGDILEVVDNDRQARAVAAERAERLKEAEQVMPTARERLQSLLEQLRAEETELRIVLKADTHGSLEALRESIGKITREDGRIDVVHGAVGGITENDVTLAEVTGAVVVGFNVRPEGKARRAAEQQGIEIRTYGIIYELLDELEQMLVGKLAPEEREVVLGSAEVRATFRVPRVGTVAGCYVTDGVVQRGARARLLRGGVVVHTGTIGSLRRFKEDVREVAAGFECGIGLEGYNDVKEGDVIEVFEVREVART